MGVRGKKNFFQKFPSPALYYIKSINRLHSWEEKHIANRVAVGEEHNETVDTEAETARGGHTVLERRDVVIIYFGT